MGKQITYQKLLAAYNKLLMENEFLHKEIDRLMIRHWQKMSWKCFILNANFSVH